MKKIHACIYSPRENLMERRNRIGENPLMFEICRDEAWDIDEELDFLITDRLMQYRKANGG